MNGVVIVRRNWIALWHPFFERLVTQHGMQLSVLTPSATAWAGTTSERCPVGDRGEAYTVTSIPCAFRLYDHEAPMIYGPQLAPQIAEAEPDVVYIIGEAGYISTVQAVRAAQSLQKRPKICLYAAQNIFQRWPFPFRQIERYCLQHIDMLFPLGDEHESVARRKGYTGPAVQMPLGVDHELFRPLASGDEAVVPQDNGPVVGYIGKLTQVKGVDLLLEAAAELTPGPRLLLIGQGPAEGRLRGLAERLGIASRITWVRAVPHRQLPAYYAAMDVLVLPSRQLSHSALHWWYRVASKEQFGRVLIEAMACERPVIGSDSGEIPRVIGDAGLVFRENDPKDLAECLAKLLSDESLCRELGLKGRQRVLNMYTWDDIVSRYYGVWRDLVEDPARA